MDRPDEEWVGVGPRKFFDRLAAEYGWTADDVAGRLEVDAATGEHRVHRSLLRPHPPFACAGDEEAAEFCREIAIVMQSTYGIGWGEAVARIDRHWSADDAGAPEPRVWIVGRDIVYHEDAEFWAGTIYFGHGSLWWNPGTRAQPLPPP